MDRAVEGLLYGLGLVIAVWLALWFYMQYDRYQRSRRPPPPPPSLSDESQ